MTTFPFIHVSDAVAGMVAAILARHAARSSLDPAWLLPAPITGAHFAPALRPFEVAMPLPDAPAYAVTSFGRVISRQRPGPAKVLRPYVTGGGGYQVKVSTGFGDRRLTVSRLVAGLFLPNPAGHSFVLYGDDDPANNLPSNLRWGTSVENHADAARNGGRPVQKLPLAARVDFFARLLAGATVADLALDFGVERATAYELVTGRRWHHCAASNGARLLMHASLRARAEQVAADGAKLPAVMALQAEASRLMAGAWLEPIIF